LSPREGVEQVTESDVLERARAWLLNGMPERDARQLVIDLGIEVRKHRQMRETQAEFAGALVAKLCDLDQWPMNPELTALLGRGHCAEWRSEK
jgi:hypothetical protein